MLFMWLIKWSWIISSRTKLFYFENGLYLEKWHLRRTLKFIHELLVIIYVYMHICCWWLYMFMGIYVAYMLLMIIYVCVHICCWWLYIFMCIYVVGESICLCAYMLLVNCSYMLLVVNCWCKHVLDYVGVD